MEEISKQAGVELSLKEKRRVMSEVFSNASELRRELEKEMTEREMPVMMVQKYELGETWAGVRVNPELKMSIKPKKDQGDDPWLEEEVVWEVTKGSGGEKRSNPKVVVENLDAGRLRRLKELPRNYQQIDEGEKACLFKNNAGENVGWTTFGERNRSVSLSFVGVVPEYEGQGFGGSILDWFKANHDSISLKPLAYDTAARGIDEARQRLRRFYVRNGFVFDSSGFFGWQKNKPNLEDAEEGSTLEVKDWLVADGTLYSNNDMTRVYLQKLKETNRLEDALGVDGAKKAESWLELRERALQMERELES